MIDEEKLRLIKVFLLAQSLDLLTTLIGVSWFGLEEQNPLLKQSLLKLSAIKIFAVILITKIFLVAKPSIKYLKIANIISSIAVFINTGSIILVFIVERLL